MYIIKLCYLGRELSGLPSKHSAKGRDRSVYFIWQGQNASLNEQGAAALLTIELDNDQAPQVNYQCKLILLYKYYSNKYFKFYLNFL